MLHYTLNTGRVRALPRSELRDDVVDSMLHLLFPGKHELPVPGFNSLAHINRTSLLVQVFSDDLPAVTFGVAPDDAAAAYTWPCLEKGYLDLGDLPGFRTNDLAASRKPAHTPWCAEMLVFVAPAEVEWISEMARHMAWTWVEHLAAQKKTQGRDLL